MNSDISEYSDMKEFCFDSFPVLFSFQLLLSQFIDISNLFSGNRKFT